MGRSAWAWQAVAVAVAVPTGAGRVPGPNGGSWERGRDEGPSMAQIDPGNTGVCWCSGVAGKAASGPPDDRPPAGQAEPGNSAGQGANRTRPPTGSPPARDCGDRIRNLISQIESIDSEYIRPRNFARRNATSLMTLRCFLQFHAQGINGHWPFARRQSRCASVPPLPDTDPGLNDLREPSQSRNPRRPSFQWPRRQSHRPAGPE